MDHSYGFSHYLAPGSKNYLIYLMALVLLGGIFIFNWNPLAVVFAYFFETIVIGVIHVFKMLAIILYGHLQNDSSPTNKQPVQLPLLLLIPFFLVHYFFFVFGQSAMVFAFMKGADPGLKDSFNVLGNYAYLFTKPDMLLAFLSIFLYQLSYSIKTFFLPGKYHLHTVDELFVQPYLRIFIQQLVAILTGFIFLLIGGPLAAALVLIAVRLITDLSLNAAKYSQHAQEKLVHLLTKGDKEAKHRESAKKYVDIFLE